MNQKEMPKSWRYNKARLEFLERHNNACEIIVRKKDCEPFAAVYYFSEGEVYRDEEIKSFFRQLRSQIDEPIRNR